MVRVLGGNICGIGIGMIMLCLNIVDRKYKCVGCVILVSVDSKIMC